MALAMGPTAGPAHAQLITGRLILESDGRGVEGAEIRLLNSVAARV